ncbi:MAG: alpha/beta hydrolase, partial [Candidatus Hodarchaeales archaeon]
MDLEIISPEFYHEGNSGTGCLLIHGFTASPTEMKPLGEYLKSHTDWDILGIRLAGHGTSPEDMAKTTYFQWIESAKEGYRRLKERNKDIYVAGLSMGSLLTTLLTSNEEITGIALLSPPFKLKSKLTSLAPILKHLLPYKRKDPSSITYLQKHDLISYSMYPTSAVVELNKLIKIVRAKIPEIMTLVIAVYSKEDTMIDWGFF